MTSAKGHYLVLIIAEGKSRQSYEYFGLLSPEESLEDAFERWLTFKTRHRKRAIDRAKAQVKAQVIRAAKAHPTSWHLERREREGEPFARKDRRRA